MKNHITKTNFIVALALAVFLTGCGGGGTTAGTADTTAPITTAAPSVSGITSTTTTLLATINENGTGYYLVQPAAAIAPTVTQVEAGTAFSMTANVAATQPISGLTSVTAYNIYFVAKDASNNMQTSVQSVPVTTQTTGYVVQGGLTWMPVTFYDTWANADAYCTTTTINGVSGWRLPTQPELSALYAVYPNNSSVLTSEGWTLGTTWSSTQYITAYHYTIYLNSGAVLSGSDASSNSVPCVR